MDFYDSEYCRNHDTMKFLHYGYRYNHDNIQNQVGGIGLYQRNVMNNADYAWRAVMIEAATYRVTDTGTIRTRSFSDTTTYNPQKWAHHEGGNYVSHGGSVRFFPNRYDPYNSGKYSWPCFAPSSPSYSYWVGAGGARRGLDQWILERDR